MAHLANEGVRRSGRARKPVQSYAAEQAEDADTSTTRPTAATKKRKQLADGAAADLENSSPPAKRVKKSAAVDRAYRAEPLSDPAEDALASGAESVEPKKAKKAAAKRKRGDPPPLDEQIRVKPHSKIYPLPEQVKAKAKVWHGDAAENRIQRAKSKVSPLQPGLEETRLRPFVSGPGEEYETFLERAKTQKMVVLARERAPEENCHAHHSDCPAEVLKIAGTKGDVYTVEISHLLSCTCPVGLFTKGGSEKACKHVLYVLHNVLKAPERLQYQNALLTSELREIFNNAPPLPTDAVKEEPMDGKRKPLTDDCGICFTELENDEETVWCRAACGNNVHATCFKQWEKARAGNVTCPFCRSAWLYSEQAGKQASKMDGLVMPTEKSKSGYVNVGHLLN
jgi:hypothetical protein